ncbi:nucleotidyltransferase, partial [Streptomyces vietnamensis]
LLRTGELRIDVGEDRDRLLAVKRGEVPWPEVESRMNRLQEEADRAHDSTPLPATPDEPRIQDFLTRARRASALA